MRSVNRNRSAVNSPSCMRHYTLTDAKMDYPFLPTYALAPIVLEAKGIDLPRRRPLAESVRVRRVG